MRSKKSAYAAAGTDNRVFKPFFISLAGHLILFGVILLNPQSCRDSENMYFPSVIDVQMVDLNDAGGASGQKTKVMEDVPIEKEAPKEEPAEVETPAPAEEVKPEISVSESKPEPKPKTKTKTALKYKTFKSQKVLKSALEKIEKEVERTPTRSLEDTIKQLREKVAEKEKSSGSATSGAIEGDGDGNGKFGPSGAGSRRQAEIVNLYMWEVATEIQKHWAYAEQFSGESKNLIARIEFKVMPDGEIKDIFFTDRSGNAYLDESAYKAIIKASPVRPNPKELALPYVHFGLNFTPKGVQ